MAELMCLESMVESRARLDPVIFRDPRILDNMLANEAASVVAADYFDTVQKDNQIRPYMRADIVKWMMEVGPEKGPRTGPPALPVSRAAGCWATFRHGRRRCSGGRASQRKATRAAAAPGGGFVPPNNPRDPATPGKAIGRGAAGVGANFPTRELRQVLKVGKILGLFFGTFLSWEFKFASF